MFFFRIQPVRTFFRTNRNTCCEWLNRIQESTTKLANLCGSPEKAIRNGFRWLQRLKNTGNTHGSEFENAIVTVIDSLIQLHCDQGVKGILDWARKEVGRDFYWLHAAIPKANGRSEYDILLKFIHSKKAKLRLLPVRILGLNLDIPF